MSVSPSNFATRTFKASRSRSTSLSAASRLLIWSTRFCRYRRAAKVFSLRFSTRDMVDEELVGVWILGEGGEFGDEWVGEDVDLGFEEEGEDWSVDIARWVWWSITEWDWDIWSMDPTSDWPRKLSLPREAPAAMGREESSTKSSPIDGSFHAGSSKESVWGKYQSGEFWKGTCWTGAVNASRGNKESAAEETEHWAFTSKPKSYPWNNGVELWSQSEELWRSRKLPVELDWLLWCEESDGGLASGACCCCSGDRHCCIVF